MNLCKLQFRSSSTTFHSQLKIGARKFNRLLIEISSLGADLGACVREAAIFQTIKQLNLSGTRPSRSLSAEGRFIGGSTQTASKRNSWLLEALHKVGNDIFCAAASSLASIGALLRITQKEMGEPKM